MYAIAIRRAAACQWLRFLAYLLLALLVAGVPSLQAADVAVREGGGFTISSGERSFSLGGRLRLDGAYFDADVTDMPAGMEVDQLLLTVQGQMSSEWGFAVGYEFVNGQMFNAHIERSGLAIGDLRVGQFRPQVGLYAGGAWIAFNHRSMVEQALALPRLMGVGVSGSQGRVNYSLSVSGDQIGRNSVGDDPLRIAGRVVIRLGADSRAPLHVGVSAVHRQLDDTGIARFSALSSAGLDDTPVLLNASQPESDYFRVLALAGYGYTAPSRCKPNTCGRRSRRLANP